MKKVLLITILIVTAHLGGMCAYAADRTPKREKFADRTILYKGEKKVGAFVIYGNLNSNNSELLLLMNNIGAEGSLFRISPNFEAAYKDNASAGVRVSYTRALASVNSLDLNLTGDLNLSLNDISVKANGFTATVFHRNYIGLSKSGTVGFYIEESLSYTGLFTDMQGGNSDRTSRVMFTLSPGFILYILPPVSIELGMGIANLGFVNAGSYSNGGQDGSRWQFKAGMNLDLLSLNLGIHYHF